MRFFFCIIIYFLLLTSCRQYGEVGNNNGLTSKITYLQIDSGKTAINYIEHFDSTKRGVEGILYSIDGQIISIIKTYYDSLNRPDFITRTGFPKNKPPVITSFQNFYDNFGLITKEVMIDSWNNGDTTITQNFYSSDKKLIKKNTTSTSTVIGQGITHLTYANNKLIKIEDFDFNESDVKSHDSIAYTDTSKVIYRFHFCNELNSKTIIIIKKNKPIKELKYNKNAFGGEMYLDSETKYSYDRLDSLVKKEEITFAHTEWCGVSSPEKKRTFTFAYEQCVRTSSY